MKIILCKSNNSKLIKGIISKRKNMYKPHPIASEPEENVTIWRYMDFVYFKELLKTGCLFFSSIDNFKDLNEGKCSVELTSLFERIRKRTYVSCWTVRNCESSLMWDSFTKSQEGIAIKSSIFRLRACLKNSKIDQYIGKVDYDGFHSIPERNTLEPYLYKSKHYEDEKEIRVLTQIIDSQSPLLQEADIESGLLVKVDLTELIESIYASPNSSNDFITKVKETLSEFNMEKSVYASEILYRPDYSSNTIESQNIQQIHYLKQCTSKNEVNSTGSSEVIMENSSIEEDSSGNIYLKYVEINQKKELIPYIRGQKEYKN